MGEHDSVVVLRLPADLKNTLQEEADQLKVSLSEMIRLKLLAVDRQAREEVVLRVNDHEIRLDELFLPEVISRGYQKQEHREKKIISINIENLKRKMRQFEEGDEDLLAPVYRAAREEAIRLGASSITPEVLLLGLLRSEAGRAVAIIRQRGVDSAQMIETLEQAIGKRSVNQDRGNIPLSKSADTAIRVADLEAKLHGARNPEPEHLLLALLRDEALIATQTLNEYGITYKRISAELE